VVYVGLVFSDAHKTLLMQHIEQTIWQSMSDDTDMLYEPRLVAALVGEGDIKANAKGELKAKAKAKAKNDKKRKRVDPEDPVGDEGDDDPADHEDQGQDSLSGDDVE